MIAFLVEMYRVHWYWYQRRINLYVCMYYEAVVPCAYSTSKHTVISQCQVQVLVPGTTSRYTTLRGSTYDTTPYHTQWLHRTLQTIHSTRSTSLHRELKRALPSRTHQAISSHTTRSTQSQMRTSTNVLRTINNPPVLGKVATVQ